MLGLVIFKLGSSVLLESGDGNNLFKDQGFRVIGLFQRESTRLGGFGYASEVNFTPKTDPKPLNNEPINP